MLVDFDYLKFFSRKSSKMVAIPHGGTSVTARRRDRKNSHFNSVLVLVFLRYRYGVSARTDVALKARVTLQLKSESSL